MTTEWLSSETPTRIIFGGVGMAAVGMGGRGVSGGGSEDRERKEPLQAVRLERKSMGLSLLFVSTLKC